jgi:hypothetical protein
MQKMYKTLREEYQELQGKQLSQMNEVKLELEAQKRLVQEKKMQIE